MPSLDEILENTMLGAASKLWLYHKLPFHPIEARPYQVPDPPPPFDSVDAAKVMDTIQRNPIWRFKSPAFGGRGVQVQNVTCKVRSMQYMEMPVLDAVEWGPVLVKSAQLGDEISLPLTSDYMVKCRYVPFSFINGSSSGLWQLPAMVDQSFELIFGYEFPLGTNSSDFRRLPHGASISLEPAPGSAAVSPADPGAGKVNTLRLPSLRIIVCVSLVCCKERFNFEPGEVLGAGRLYPLIMVMANMPLDLVTASVKLTRPAQNMSQMGDELMVSDSMGAYLFTDRNKDPRPVPLGPPLPYWDNFFDYYLIAPPADKYLMVTRPKVNEQPRTIKDAVTNSIYYPMRGMVDTVQRDVTKLPGQGEFDNIHMAPKMQLSDLTIKNKNNAGLTGLDDITMAPFCVHDCFHMHWRWAPWATNTSNKGWVVNQPFAKPGAPLVPGNQEVTIELHSKVSFTYTAKAENAPAGEWQVFLHHGGAYALYVGRLGDLGKLISQVWAGKGIVGDSGWAALYWDLRYGRSHVSQFERITWTDAQLNLLREKPGAAQPAAAAAVGAGGP